MGEPMEQCCPSPTSDSSSEDEDKAKRSQRMIDNRFPWKINNIPLETVCRPATIGGGIVAEGSRPVRPSSVGSCSVASVSSGIGGMSKDDIQDFPYTSPSSMHSLDLASSVPVSISDNDMNDSTAMDSFSCFTHVTRHDQSHGSYQKPSCSTRLSSPRISACSLKRANSAPMINELSNSEIPPENSSTDMAMADVVESPLVIQRSNPIPIVSTMHEVEDFSYYSNRVRRASTPCINRHTNSYPRPSSVPQSPTFGNFGKPSQLKKINQLKYEERCRDEINQEKDLQDTLHMSRSWDDLRLEDAAGVVAASPSSTAAGGVMDSGHQWSSGGGVGGGSSGSCRMRKSCTDPLYVSPVSASLSVSVPGSPIHSPNSRVGRQCFSPSLQQTVKHSGFSPSPSASPTHRFHPYRRSSSPVAFRPSPSNSSLKRKYDFESDCSRSPKRLNCEASTIVFPHPLIHSISSSSTESFSCDQPGNTGASMVGDSSQESDSCSNGNGQAAGFPPGLGGQSSAHGPFGVVPSHQPQQQPNMASTPVAILARGASLVAPQPPASDRRRSLPPLPLHGSPAPSVVAGSSGAGTPPECFNKPFADVQQHQADMS